MKQFHSCQNPPSGCRGIPGREPKSQKFLWFLLFKGWTKPLEVLKKFPPFPKTSDGMPGHSGERTQVMKVSLVSFFSKKGTPWKAYSGKKIKEQRCIMLSKQQNISASSLKIGIHSVRNGKIWKKWAEKSQHALPERKYVLWKWRSPAFFSKVFQNFAEPMLCFHSSSA